MKKLNPIHFTLPKHILCNWIAFVICMGAFMIGIYKITSPSKKIYIGQSIDIEGRFIHYKKLRCKYQPYLYNSLKKYGVENHTFEILCECEVHELNDKERYYQDLYSVMGPNGMNLALTKSTDRSGAYSDESKKKMSNSQKGKTMPPEVRLKISNANKGRVPTDETKLKISNANKGKIASPETRLKISNSKKGVVISIQQRKKISETAKLVGVGKWMKGKKLSVEHIKNISKAQCRENNNAWIDGRSSDPKWRNWIKNKRNRIPKTGSHTGENWENLKVEYNFTCPSCLKSEPEIKLIRNHIIPLSKDGSDNIENIQPLCGSCSSRKHTKIIKYQLP